VSDKKVRILHLISTSFVGGPEKQILNHAVDATSSGREIWVGSFRDGLDRTAILKRAEELGLPTLEVSPGGFDPRSILELVRSLRRQEISLLCTYGYKADILGCLASRLGGCPQVAFVRGWTAETWRVRQYERLDRFVLRRLDWVACVSQPQAEQLSKKRTGRNPPVVIPNAVLCSSGGLTLPLDRRPIRRTLGLPESAFSVGAVGRLSVEKGHRYLIDAGSTLVPKIPNLQFVFLGEGRERPKLEKQLARLGMRERVVFAGFQTDVRPWIQACDLIANPSLTEGMPNAVLEAMALGTPVVATAVGGVPDMIQNQVSGLLVPPADPTALASAILDLFANPARALEFARAAQTKLEKFSPAEQCERLLDLYAEVLQLQPQERPGR
jgi:glycosyltransferase involved in cell wall biosynthesis